MRGRRIAVVGDVMLDCYLHGPLERISPEAPVPVFEIAREEFKLGGAANVAACLSALGAEVKLAGVVGKDDTRRASSTGGQQPRHRRRSTLVDPGGPRPARPASLHAISRYCDWIEKAVEPLGEADRARVAGSNPNCVGLGRCGDSIRLCEGSADPERMYAAIRAANGKPVIVDPKKLPVAPLSRCHGPETEPS